MSFIRIKNYKTALLGSIIGKLAFSLIKEMAVRMEEALPNLTIEVIAIRNDFFGELVTVAGLVTGQCVGETRYRVRLNDPSVIDLHRTVSAEGAEYDCAYIELGNPGIPHAVVLVDDWDTWETDRLQALGRALRFAPAFPKGANVSFVKFIGQDGVENFTLACGTGCGSITTALTLRGLAARELSINMPGGLLNVSIRRDGNWAFDIFLTGPTCLVFEGEVSDELLEDLCRIY